MNGKNRYFTVNGGVSLILLVFIILSLVSFAALSVVSARADSRLTEKYRTQTDGYYRARNEAQHWLQELDAGTAGPSPSAGPLTRSFPAGSTQELVVTVDTDPAGSFRILSEKTKSTVSFDYDSTLPVLKK